ncbi:MAG: TonB-dependent receptor [Bacteroidales bacterium]|nr:TonB-dependent receptor [Bacteroidales bacterium]MBN2818964.1 TonB-dependent receptor [Bacteroidales bacterium]
MNKMKNSYIMKRLLSRTIVVLSIILSANTMHAQSVTVTGIVTDATDNSALTGVNVVVQGTQTGAVTNIDGHYSIHVEVGKVLEFSMIGYLPEKVEVTTQTEINIILTQDIAQLDEVVVIGYGTQRKVDLTGSVAVVDAEEMKKVSHSNISTMLEGKVAGVQITSDGQPGADPTVRIRGLSTFGNSNPLYIIDGVPMGTTIRDFSPNDIATIQVLKDASAAAIYGSRAANGVVIITTKQGIKNQAMKIDYKGYFGFDQVKKGVYEVMDAEQYGEYITEAFGNNNQPVPSGYDPASENYLYSTDGTAKVNTNWYDEAFKTGTRQNQNINVSGGGENNTYNIALDYFSQEGTIEGAGPNFDRYTARINNTMDVKFIKIKTNIVYSHSDQDNMALSNANEYVQGLYGAQYPVMASALITPPTIMAYDESTWVLDDKISAASDYQYDSYGYGTYYDDVHGDLRVTNVLLTNNLLERNVKVDRLVASGSAVVDFLDMVGLENGNHKLNYNLNLSFNKTFAKDFTFVPAFIQSTTNYLSKNNETLEQRYRNYTDALIENYINYDGKFGLNHINVVVGHTFERDLTHELYGKGVTMPEPYYLQVNNAEDRDASSNESERVLESFIGRLIYDFDEKYLLTATVRKDGSSRLSPKDEDLGFFYMGNDDNYDFFPSVSAGWRIDRESFFSVSESLISLLKLRGSYGVLGNTSNLGNYDYMAGMARLDYTYSFGNNKVNGSSVSNYVNTALRWEKKKTVDLGLDLAMLNNKLEFNFDWYQSTADGLHYDVAVPAEAGVTNTTVKMNAATIVNSGLEFLLAYRNYDGELKYEVSANFSTLSNEVTKLGVSGEPRNDGNSRTEVGSEVGQFYGLVSDGIFQSQAEIDNHSNDEGGLVTQNGAQPGDVRYKDINNDGEITLEGDREFLGSGLPNFSYGLNARVEYRGIDLSISTYGAAGFDAVDFVDVTLRSSYGALNKDVELLNAWTPENTNTDIPRVAFKPDGDITNDMFSDRFLQNATYLKIANIELGYNLPDEWFGGYISGLRVYASGQNLITLSAYKGYNVDFAGGTFTPGYNYASYPTPRTIMFGLNVSF